MCALGGKKGLVWLVQAALLLSSAPPGVVFAGGKGGDGPPTRTDAAKPGTAKLDAPTPLTERERRMLDRMEELEKRVAELEAKGQPATPSSSENAASQPSAVATPTATGVAGTAGGSEVGNAISPTAVSTAPGTQEKATTKPAKSEPFTFADFTWLNGNARTKEAAMDTKFFTPEIRVDAGYVYDFNHPKDDTIGGSAEVFRAQEFNLTQLGVGGDFHYDNVRGRVMTQFGMYSQTQPRNDASPTRGQWGLDGAYRYLAEAYGGVSLQRDARDQCGRGNFHVVYRLV
jgi:hypothetical protein